MRKNDPQRAVLDVTEWRDTELAKKGSKASELSTSGASVEKQLRTDPEADINADVGPETSRTTATATISTGVTDTYAVPKRTEAEAEAHSNGQADTSNGLQRRDLSHRGLETSTPLSMIPSNTANIPNAETPMEAVESNGQVPKQALPSTVEHAVDQQEQQQHTDAGGHATEQKDLSYDASIIKDQLTHQDMPISVQALLPLSLPPGVNDPPPASGESSDTSDGSSSSSRSSSSASRHSDDDEAGDGNNNDSDSDSDSDDSNMGSEPPLATQSIYFD